MKKILLAILICLTFIGCNKNEDGRSMAVTNLTGLDLYDADIIFLREKEGSTHRAPESLGLFENGTTKKVSYDDETLYFSIFAKTQDGELAYTNDILISGYNTGTPFWVNGGAGNIVLRAAGSSNTDNAGFSVTTLTGDEVNIAAPIRCVPKKVVQYKVRGSRYLHCLAWASK